MNKIDTRTPVDFKNSLTLEDHDSMVSRLSVQPMPCSQYRKVELSLEESRFQAMIRDVNTTLSRHGKTYLTFYDENADRYKKLAALYHYYGWIVTVEKVYISKQDRHYYQLNIRAEEPIEE